MFIWNISFLKSFWRNVSRLAFLRDGILHRFIIMKKYKLQRNRKQNTFNFVLLVLIMGFLFVCLLVFVLALVLLWQPNCLKHRKGLHS